MLLFFLLVAAGLKAQIDPIVHSVYLIGDTGKDTIPSEALFLMAFEAIDHSNSTVVFLGDNVYPNGNHPWKSGTREFNARRILLSQLELFSTFEGDLFMIPGNHDWNAGRLKGLSAVKYQKTLVDSFTKKNSVNANAGNTYFKTPGTPGPQLVKLHNGLNLILIDTQWWLHADLLHRVEAKSGRNAKHEKDLFLQRLDSLLADVARKGEWAVVCGHHPMYSNGNHAHRREPLRFLLNYTPLHIFSWMGMNRFLRQDLFQPRYKKLRKNLRAVMSKYPNTVYVSGHEHNMQYLKDRQVHYVVSGAGSKISMLDRYIFPAQFMEDQQTGFMRISLHESGWVRLSAYGVRERGVYWQTNLFYLDRKNFLPR